MNAYRGDLPQVGASTTQLSLAYADRGRGTVGAQESVPAHARHHAAAVELTYRPRFTFQKTL